MRSPYPEFVLTNIICIEKALKGTEVAFVLTGISYNSVRTNEVYCTRVNSHSLKKMHAVYSGLYEFRLNVQISTVQWLSY